MSVFEIVEFTLKPGLDAEAFLALVPPTEAFCRAAPGFLQRWLTQGDAGRWLDIVEWADMASAHAAAEAFMRAPGVPDFVAAIDGPSVTMKHVTAQIHMAA